MSGAMIGAGIGMAAMESAMDLHNNLIQGAVSRYWNRSDSKRSAQLQYRYNKKFNEWLIPFQLDKQYEYAERYSHNTPSWNVSGLRHAGLNPILAASGGFSGGSSPHTSVGSSGSVTAPHTNLSSSRSANVIAAINGLKQNELLDEQIKGQQIKNKRDALNIPREETQNAVEELKHRAELDLLKPLIIHGPSDGSKTVDVIQNTEAYKALQKSIKDNYDLGSEKYLRTTIDAAARYGTDVLKLLPAFRKRELLQAIIKTSPKK